MSNTDELTVLKLLGIGRSLAFAATAAGLDLAAVTRFATAAGYPDEAVMKARVEELLSEAQVPIPMREPEAAPPVETTPRVALRPVPSPAPSASSKSTAPAPTLEELVRACRRSEFKRTQSLGVKLADLAEKVTAALHAERESAEDKAQRAAEREAAQAEVKRLEKALAAARAKAVAAGAPGGTRGGERTCPVCDAGFPSPQALGAHKRHKHGIPGMTASTETRTA